MIWTVIFAGVLLITAYYVFALLYHWVRYGATMPFVWIALPIYLVGVVFLLTIALAAYTALV
ncbi:MAG: hypothetical protein NBV63_01730 [Candidatus Pacebacteria bacterium]|jgi:hypothetical protein|nr:hypothetical protein [Candidatus Paceibacterota bacterium]